MALAARSQAYAKTRPATLAWAPQEPWMIERPALDDALVRRLHGRARADRWGVSTAQWRDALEAAVAHAAARRVLPSRAAREAYATSLPLDDLALACGCAIGNDAAWEHVVREYRPILYRAADGLDPSGGARDIADALYAELFGVRERGTERQSLFRYYHGRSSLATWLRAVLAQRHVDRFRLEGRFVALPDDDGERRVPAASAPPPDVDRRRYIHLVQRVLAAVIETLAPRDRLRLACYYAQGLTLAQTGQLLREHEATVSRQLGRTRRHIRADAERRLANEGLADAEIDRCFALLLEDAGTLDLEQILGAAARKDSDPERSL